MDDGLTVVAVQCRLDGLFELATDPPENPERGPRAGIAYVATLVIVPGRAPPIAALIFSSMGT